MVYVIDTFDRYVPFETDDVELAYEFVNETENETDLSGHRFVIVHGTQYRDIVLFGK